MPDAPPGFKPNGAVPYLLPVRPGKSLGLPPFGPFPCLSAFGKRLWLNVTPGFLRPGNTSLFPPKAGFLFFGMAMPFI